MIRVALGIIRDDNGRMLLAKRPEGKYLSGLWEFPGGKVEEGEASRDALVRELREEIGIEVQSFNYLTQVVHDYPDRTVCLDVWLVESFVGEPRGCEGQSIAWVAAHDFDKLAVPEGSRAVFSVLSAS